MRRALQIVIVLLFNLAIVGFGLEAMIRIPEAISSALSPGRGAIAVTDPLLGRRPNPHYAGHDRRGWRNLKALDRADVVALGDSQTYGEGVKPDEAWPQQLGGIIGRPVYQMAFGGYSPTHALRLMPEVMKLQPKVVVVAVYLGADLTNAFEDTYYGPNSAEISDLRSTDQGIVKSAKRAMQIDAGGWIRSEYLDCESKRAAPDERLLAVSGIIDLPPLKPLSEGRSLNSSFWNVLYASKLFVRLKSQLVKGRIETPVGPGLPYCLQASAHGVRAILSPGYRLIAVDETDPRNIEGERITVAALKRIKEIAAAGGAKLICLMIPTKEKVFFPFVHPPVRQSKYLDRLNGLETSIRDRIKGEVEADDIITVDAVGGLRKLIASGVDPYQGVSSNGHPSPRGYWAIAESVATELQEAGL